MLFDKISDTLDLTETESEEQDNEEEEEEGFTTKEKLMLAGGGALLAGGTYAIYRHFHPKDTTAGPLVRLKEKWFKKTQECLADDNIVTIDKDEYERYEEWRNEEDKRRKEEEEKERKEYEEFLKWKASKDAKK